MGGGVVGEPVEGAVSGLFKHTPEVFADDAEAHEIQAAEDGDEDGHGRPAGDGFVHHDAVEDMKDEKDACDGREDTQIECHTQRQGGIRDDAVHREVQHFFHGKFRDTGVAGRRFKFDGTLLEAKSAYDAADEAGMLTETQKGIERFAIHQAEVGAARDDGRV